MACSQATFCKAKCSDNEPKDKSDTRSVAFNEVESSDQSFARVRTGTVLCSCVARTRNTRLVPTLDQLQEMQAFLASRKIIICYKSLQGTSYPLPYCLSTYLQ